MRRLLTACGGLFSGRARETGGVNPRVILREDRPQVLYAVGDIHGCLDLYEELEAMILEDAAQFSGPADLILLGDLVDRGPSTAQMLDRMLAPPRGGMRRTMLAGNHEMMMLGFLEDPKANMAWLAHGGKEALYHHLLHEVDTTGFETEPHPRTAGFREQARHSLKGAEKLVDAFL
ncbi:MAG: metallophosphoesterase, partial [Pannonibacter indicus]